MDGMKRILIVDNKEERQRLLQSLIRDQGHEVVIASDAADALTSAQRQVPDLLVFDLHLPQKDGCPLLHHWREDARLKAVPFIGIPLSPANLKASHGHWNRGQMHLGLTSQNRRCFCSI